MAASGALCHLCLQNPCARRTGITIFWPSSFILFCWPVLNQRPPGATMRTGWKRCPRICWPWWRKLREFIACADFRVPAPEARTSSSRLLQNDLLTFREAFEDFGFGTVGGISRTGHLSETSFVIRDREPAPWSRRFLFVTAPSGDGQHAFYALREGSPHWRSSEL